MWNKPYVLTLESGEFKTGTGYTMPVSKQNKIKRNKTKNKTTAKDEWVDVQMCKMDRQKKCMSEGVGKQVGQG